MYFCGGRQEHYNKTAVSEAHYSGGGDRTKGIFDSLPVVKMSKVPDLDESTMRVALTTDVCILHSTVTTHSKVLVHMCSAVNSCL
jgi:hypothetical protein